MSEKRIYGSREELASAMADFFVELAKETINIQQAFTVALSGGETPVLFYELLATKYKDSIIWPKTHFFWCDERCVPPDNKESNYKLVNDLFLKNINIPESNVHRIFGEADPVSEIMRYEDKILTMVSDVDSNPQFDLVILGLGEDGHTASLFPNQMFMVDSVHFCEAASHPKTGQRRITMTPALINKAKHVAFLVSGNSKAEKVHAIINQEPEAFLYPAYYIQPSNGTLYWFLDKEAAKQL